MECHASYMNNNDNNNNLQKFQCVSTLLPLCASCVDIRELEPARFHRAHPGLYRHMY